MQSHSEAQKNQETQNTNPLSPTPATTSHTSHTWIHGDQTEQLLSQLPALEQRIVNSFLHQLADKEKVKTPMCGHKFFDPLAGP